ncbi:MAG: UDP-N-acetylmuramoyl-L-alanyl-D-glutamate--2,6-diaminopimelate ligase [Planctomycetes bacterium]|nr:UDP-N-acetylmuramoyl-L-alanyl-D-glutamate--2,6-diaminopimelate ligase [Planctomycetota bacterium]
MKLSDLAQSVPGSRLRGPGDAEVRRAVHDSRQVQAGDLFVALPGTKVDGHEFVGKAFAAGAVAAAVEREVPAPDGRPLLLVPSSREALGLAAHILAGDPTRQLTVCGVTGTSGKTTTTYLIRSILEKSGLPTGLIGTISYIVGGRETASTMTTPDSSDLAPCFAEMVRAGCRACVMEVSSHALHQRRTAGIRFAVAAFTNLSSEHRDYHRTMKDYREAKGLLFRSLEPGAWAVLNRDDRASRAYARGPAARDLWYGLTGKADVTAEDIQPSLAGSRFTLITPRGRAQVRTHLLGRHNVMNCLAAAGVAEALAIPLETIAAGIEALPSVRGRLEVVPSDKPFAVLVDYAHKTEALRQALSAVADLLEGDARLIVVFGCGGDRDRTKRPRMAAVAERLADRIIVTSDNPRSERPEDIAAQICKGFLSRRRVTVELDRRKAIAAAIALARPGDVIVIAGKGHEDYQITGQTKRHFDDRETAAEILAGSA